MASTCLPTSFPIMANPKKHTEDETVEAFDEEYTAAHLGATSLQPGALAAYVSENASPAPPEDEEDEGHQGPIDITKWHGPSTREEITRLKANRAQKADLLVKSCATMIDCLGEDLSREGLLKTPLRMAKALQYFTSGYETALSGTL